MIDWGALSVVGGLSVALLGVAGSYGMWRQKVRDMDQHLDDQDLRIEKIERAIDAARETKSGVDLLQAELRSFKVETGLRQDAVLSEVRHLGELWTERFNSLQRAAGRAAQRSRQS